jgi:hypothetical protein
VYKNILTYAQQSYAAGDYVTHAYVRLYQNAPKDYGIKREKTGDTAITSGPEWKCTNDSLSGWNALECIDQAWYPAQRAPSPKNIEITGFPKDVPRAMWYGDGNPQSEQTYKPAQKLFLRRTFYCSQAPPRAVLYLMAIDQVDAYLNGILLPRDSAMSASWNKACMWDLQGKIRSGKNVIALAVKNNIKMAYGVFPYLVYTSTTNDYLPQPPGSPAPLDTKLVAEGTYVFPSIRNFPETKAHMKKTAGK